MLITLFYISLLAHNRSGQILLIPSPAQGVCAAIRQEEDFFLINTKSAGWQRSEGKEQITSLLQWVLSMRFQPLTRGKRIGWTCICQIRQMQNFFNSLWKYTHLKQRSSLYYFSVSSISLCSILHPSTPLVELFSKSPDKCSYDIGKWKVGTKRMASLTRGNCSVLKHFHWAQEPQIS